MSTHWKAILGVALIFVLGFTSGAVCSSIFVHRKMVAFLKQPGAAAELALEKRLTRNMVLDENQRQQIHGYFQENLQSRRDLNREIQPQVRMANLQTFQKIDSILRPDQRQLFHQNIEEFRKRAGKILPKADMENLPTTGASSAPVDATVPAGH